MTAPAKTEAKRRNAARSRARLFLRQRRDLSRRDAVRAQDDRRAPERARSGGVAGVRAVMPFICAPHVASRATRLVNAAVGLMIGPRRASLNRLVTGLAID